MQELVATWPEGLRTQLMRAREQASRQEEARRQTELAEARLALYRQVGADLGRDVRGLVDFLWDGFDPRAEWHEVFLAPPGVGRPVGVVYQSVYYDDELMGWLQPPKGWRYYVGDRGTNDLGEALLWALAENDAPQLRRA